MSTTQPVAIAGDVPVARRILEAAGRLFASRAEPSGGSADAAASNAQRQIQLYAALSQCNRAIVHCSCAAELFPQVCRAAVRFGGMEMAWVGMVDPRTRLVRPVASFGDAGGYLRDIVISLDGDSPFGNGPTPAAIREDRPQWCQDYQNDPATAPWRERGAGWGSLAALPLHRDGTVVGAFVLYAEEPGAFDQPERHLLEEMAGDVSFALGNFARETTRRQAEERLRAAEEKFRGLVEQAIAGIFIIQDGRLAYVNRRCAEIIGHGDADELLGTDLLGRVAEADRAVVGETVRRLLDGEARDLPLDFAVPRPDGSEVQIGANAARATHEGRPAVIGMMQDISEKKQAAEEIQRHVVRLKTALMRTVDVATIISEKRDPYTVAHQRRVAEIAAAIGAELGLDLDRQEGLRVAGCLHDVGKVIVPTEILSRPGRLNPVEFLLIQGHAQAGYDVLKGVDFPWPVAEVALQHHERMDGSGYPNGLKAEAILLEARIMAVADVVEAMSSHRPYRPGRGLAEALAEVESGRGSRYDPDVAAACLRLFRHQGYQLPTG